MSNRSRQILILLLAALLVFTSWWRSGNHSANRPGNSTNPPTFQEESCPGTALSDRQTAERLGERFGEGQGRHQTPVYGQGEVVKVLPDDNEGIRHQRFLLRVAPGLTVLVAHNSDLAPRIDGLAAGDRLSFCGEYIWNDKGGVLHWTHHDPKGKHPDGWLRFNGKLYR